MDEWIDALVPPAFNHELCVLGLGLPSDWLEKCRFVPRQFAPEMPAVVRRRRDAPPHVAYRNEDLFGRGEPIAEIALGANVGRLAMLVDEARDDQAIYAARGENGSVVVRVLRIERPAHRRSRADVGSEDDAPAAEQPDDVL